MKPFTEMVSEEWVRRRSSARDKAEMLKELVQVAAMAQRAAEDNGLIG